MRAVAFAFNVLNKRIMVSKNQIIDLYRKRAERYDFTDNLYYLSGIREYAFAFATVCSNQGIPLVGSRDISEKFYICDSTKLKCWVKRCSFLADHPGSSSQQFAGI